MTIEAVETAAPRRDRISLAVAHWPAAAAVGVYWLATAALVRAAIQRTNGHLVYPLDDAYIHMAMAKNAALHHVWAVTPDNVVLGENAASFFAVNASEARPLVDNLRRFSSELPTEIRQAGAYLDAR